MALNSLILILAANLPQFVGLPQGQTSSFRQILAWKLKLKPFVMHFAIQGILDLSALILAKKTTYIN